MKRFVMGALAAAAAITIASPALAQGGPGGCSRERLIEIANQYRAAQKDGRAIMHMMPMGEWVNYYENYELSSMAFAAERDSPTAMSGRAPSDTISSCCRCAAAACPARHRKKAFRWSGLEVTGTGEQLSRRGASRPELVEF